MADFVNRKIVLAKRPRGVPSEDCFRLEEVPAPELAEGQVLIATAFLSIDAFIRTSLDDDSYHPSVAIGGTVSALGVGRVLESNVSEFVAGDAVVAPLGAQTHAALPAVLLQKVDPTRAPLSAYLGVLGLTAGITAYFGVREVGAVRPGETVVVSAAAGAVGSMACQIARLEGARVIGIAGGPEKARYLLEDLGLAGAIDYRGDDVAARLRELAPDGIDVFFDNVGGPLLDVALDQIRERARVVICGAISQYQNMDRVQGPSLYLRLAERHARMEGFAVTHFRSRFPEASSRLAAWLEGGELALREQIECGIERFPRALLKLFDGGHVGKLLVAV